MLFSRARPTLAEAKKRVLARPPRLSAVVLNWNRKALLKRTVESLLATSPPDLELIVVDNASSDGSREWIRSLAELRPGVRAVLLDENQGAESLNRVLPQCRGDLIL